MGFIPSFIPNADKINGAVNEFFGTDGIDVIRSVQWDRKYLWTVDFVDAQPPSPFNVYFPASEVTIPMAILETEEIRFGQSDVKIPSKTTSKEMSITFYDDENRTLLNYFKDWVEIDILNNGKYISGIKDDHAPEVTRKILISGGEKVRPVRTVELKLLDGYRKTIQNFKYGVYPTGQIDFVGDHSSEASMYTVNFVIISEIGKNKIESKTSYADVAKDLLGRFL